MKISFSELDREQLQQISQGVIDGKRIEELIKIGQEISMSILNPEFLFVCPAILLTFNNQLYNAIRQGSWVR